MTKRQLKKKHKKTEDAFLLCYSLLSASIEIKDKAHECEDFKRDYRKVVKFLENDIEWRML